VILSGGSMSDLQDIVDVTIKSDQDFQHIWSDGLRDGSSFLT